MQDYLKVAYKLSVADREVTTTALADALGVSAASATSMMKKMAELKLARHTPYYGVELTPAGRKVALEVIRHHRLIELYLSEALGFPWDQVHDEAERLEHHISEAFETRIAETLGNPTRDPHGDPIPSREGRIVDVHHQSLAEMPAAGQAGVVCRVSDHSAERLRYLGSLGLRPDATFIVVERTPFNGPIRLRLGDREISIGTELAQIVYVTTPK
ncbi:MAG: metal-dependent transcriptional regulator [Chloroflexi bacterium]|nr:metal-dependent transcriptional regulator [Chloroflexota bacterium]